MAKKNLKNPFKLSGSYIGALIGWVSLALFGSNYLNFWFLDIWQGILNLPSVSWGAIPPVLITGFLVGWGIEYMLRK